IEKAPGGLLPKGGGDDTIITTTLRTGDRFTTRYQEGSLIITLTGTVAGGKAKVGEITVQDGGVKSTCTEVAKVPAQYRDKVQRLLDVSSGGGLQIQKK